MRASSVFAMILVIAANVAAWIGLNPPRQAPAFDKPFSGLSYSPYREGQDPQKGDRISAIQIAEDMAFLADKTQRVRTYTAIDGHEAIPYYAGQYGLKVTAGAWIDGHMDRNEKEITNVVAMARGEIVLYTIGVVGMLLITGTAFSMQAYIGVIMLAGIVVSNAILLVDYTNTLRERDKMPLREAIELAGRHRLRPILMTSICTALGLVPMALGIGEGAELQAPLARVVIGGLITSTMITLVFVPAMYTLFEEGWRGIFRRGAATSEAAH